MPHESMYLKHSKKEGMKHKMSLKDMAKPKSKKKKATFIRKRGY